ASFTLENGDLRLERGLLTQIESGAIGAVDLYEEVAVALASDTTEDHYARRIFTLSRNGDRGKQDLLRILYRSLRELRFQAAVLTSCDFFHVGTSRQILTGLTTQSRTSVVYSFRNFTRTIAPN